MPTTFSQSFASGELAPGLRYRSDLAKWRSGAAKLSNMFVHFSGGASNRSGTQFIDYGRFDTPSIWFVPFVFSTDQAYVLEFTYATIRIIAHGAFVTDGGVPIEVVTPYLDTELRDLKFTQANDVMTITHPSHGARELKRFGLTTWTLTTVDFGTALVAPTSLAATAQGSTPGGTPTPTMRNYTYSVTAVGTSPPDESALAGAVNVNNYDLGYNGQAGVANQLTWDAATGAAYYNVYRYYQGVWAFVGSTAATSFLDANVLPDTATTAPEHDNPFDGGNNPVSVGYYQQRRVFGGTALQPLAIYFTRSGNYSSMDVSQPLRPDDAVAASLVARENNAIRHLIPLQDLVVLTASAAWTVSGNNGVVTPADVVVKPQAYVGASHVTPVTINYDILFSREKGGGLTAISYEFQANGFIARDLAVLASHLFVGRQVVQLAWAESPHKILWCLMSDGTLCGFTYLREQDVYAWHTHDTAGSFLSIACIPEDGEDVLYVAVRRGLGAQVRTTLERMKPRVINDPAPDITQAWFVDCGLQYNGAPATTISGLDHLNGNLVSILADGNVQPQQIVTGGTVTLAQPASRVTVGLAFTAELQTLPLDGPAGQSVLGARKRASQLRVFQENTRGIQAAVLEPGQTPQYAAFKERAFEAWGTPVALYSGSREVQLPGNWTLDASLSIRQTDPLPCTILGVMPDVTIGEFG